MFCDLVGSTALAHKIDPEQLRDLMRAYQQACGVVIEKYDGHVAQYLGDGLMVYFGWPRAHEDDPERAVHVSLEILQAVKTVRAPSPLQVRVGIATGPVVVGETGGGDASVPKLAVGETPNLAARLQGLAGADEIVVAATTRRLLGGAFEYRDLGSHTLKGIVEPVPAWRVEGLGATDDRFEANHGEQLTPLIGREEELALLLRRWEQAKEGEGQVVLLSGEPGIGKSRLANAVREHMGKGQGIRVPCQCSPYHTHSALYPFIVYLERAAGFESADSAEQRLEKLERWFKRSSEELDRHVPLLAALLSVPTGDRYPPVELSPQRQKEETLQALLVQLRGLSNSQPVLIVFEDAQWADHTSLELLDQVVEQAQRLAVLLLITFRPEFRPPWTAHSHITSLTLNRFSRRLAASMVEQLWVASIPPEVLEEIIAKTDGVPLFVEELTRAMAERPWTAGDRDQGGAPARPLTIPATLQDSLMERLDRAPTVKEVAQTASVIGREFSKRLLAAITPLGEAELADALDQLVAAGLAFRRGTLSEASYSFKHALVRDAAYDSLLRKPRRQLHARIADALKAEFPETAAAQPELLAHHYTEAGRVPDAIEYWLRAGLRAAEHSANQEAVGHLRSGLEVCGTLPESTERARQELALLQALSGPQMATAGWGSEEATETYARARELCALLGETEHLFPVLHGQWINQLMAGELRTAHEVATQLLDLADQHQDTTAIMLGHRMLGWSALLLGRLAEVRLNIDTALALYDPERHSALRFRYVHDARVAAYCCRVCYQWLTGLPEQALATSKEAIAYARDLKHPSTLAFALFLGGLVATMARDPKATERSTAELLALCDEQGFRLHRSWGRAIAGWAMGKLGRPAEGASQLQRAIEDLMKGGQKVFLPLYLALLTELHLDRGELQEALQVLDRAADLVEHTHERWWEADLHRLTGEVLLARGPGGREDAETHFRRALELAHAIGAKSLELRATTRLARLIHGHSSPAEARTLLQASYGQFGEGFGSVDLLEAQSFLESIS